MHKLLAPVLGITFVVLAFGGLLGIVISDQHQFCEVSLKRWTATTAIVKVVTSPIDLPADTPENAYNYHRVVQRNAQLADEAAQLTTILGPKPAC